MDIKVETVTPKMAAEWLEHNVNNRNARPRIVRQYASDMIEGRWRLNGDPIRLNGGMNLLDGQHRLMACVEADTAFETVVIRGLKTDDKTTFDAGVKRNFSDILKFKGEKNTYVLAALIRGCWTYETYPNPVKARGEAAPSHQQMLEWFENNDDARAAVSEAGKVRQTVPAPATSIGLVYLYGFRTDPEDTADFFAKLRSGEGLFDGSPILALRRNLELARSKRHKKPSTEHTTALVIKAFNLYLNGEEVEYLSWRGGGVSAEAYPRIAVTPSKVGKRLRTHRRKTKVAAAA